MINMAMIKLIANAWNDEFVNVVEWANQWIRLGQNCVNENHFCLNAKLINSRHRKFRSFSKHVKFHSCTFFSSVWNEISWSEGINVFTHNVLFLCYAICISFHTHIRPIQFAIRLVRLRNWIQLMDFGKSTYKHTHMLRCVFARVWLVHC